MALIWLSSINLPAFMPSINSTIYRISHLIICIPLDSSSILQEPVQLPSLRLQVAVPTNVLLTDKDIRHTPLSRDPLERILERGTVFCSRSVSTPDLGRGAVSRESQRVLGRHLPIRKLRCAHQSASLTHRPRPTPLESTWRLSRSTAPWTPCSRGSSSC